MVLLETPGATDIARARPTGKVWFPMDAKTLLRFWDKVDKNGPVPAHRPGLGKCWVWTGCLTSAGYGYFRFGRRMQIASRVAWLIRSGDIPKHDSHHGICVLHRCDNPPCVRGSHLFLGTHRRNMADRDAKGRLARGEDLPQSKLTEAGVLAVRSRYAAGGVSQREIAEELGVDQSLISYIVNRKLWRCVP